MEITVAGVDDLDPRTAHAVWRLRQDVFVVEQDCPYPDLDDRDLEPATRHVVVRSGAGDVVATARVLDDGASWRIGRIVVRRDARGSGLSGELMRAALTATEGDDRDVVLDAQSPLAGWYGTFGFVRDGDEFLEDGIPHTPMRLAR